jgi:hypothetical protein
MTRTTAQVQADLDAAYSARSSIIAGERVTEVSRDGRRLTFERMTLEQANELIDTLERELASAEAISSGRPRRRPISVMYPN